MISLHIDPKEFKRILLPLASMPKEMRGAVWQAVKRALDTTKKELSGNIAAVSFLRKNIINQAITKPQIYGKAMRGNQAVSTDSIMGAVRVSSRLIEVDKYRLVPRRVTSRKGVRSVNWQTPGFKIGPREAVRYRQGGADLSKGFILRGKKGLRFFQRVIGKTVRYPSGKTGPALFRTAAYTVQYFAVFKSTLKNLEPKTRERFEAVLQHEVNYRLSKLK